LPFGIRIAGMGRKIEENFILRMLNKDWSHLTPNEIALLNT
jgi:hypothetical protein